MLTKERANLQEQDQSSHSPIVVRREIVNSQLACGMIEEGNDQLIVM